MTTTALAAVGAARIVTVTRGRAAAALVADLLRAGDRLAAAAGHPVEFSGVHSGPGTFDRMALAAALDLVARARPWIVVEAIGLPEAGSLLAARALRGSASVVSASPSVVAGHGPRLHDLAAAHGVSYLIAGTGRPLAPLVALAVLPQAAARAVRCGRAHPWPGG